MKTPHITLRHIDHAALKLVSEAIDRAVRTKESEIVLLIDCKGGDVETGLKIIDAIRASPIPFHAHVEHAAGSMAAVIFQTAKRRSMASDATLHYHYGSWRVSFLIYFDQVLLERNRQKAIELQRNLIEPLIARGRLTEEDAHALLREDVHLGADECLARGLVDEIVPSLEQAAL